jgi:CHASE3 domain sensor protein
VGQRNKLWAYLCAGVVLFLFFALEQMVLLKQWHEAVEAQQQRSAIREEVLKLRRLTSDIYNGFRGYVLMRQSTFLTPMVAAEEEIPLALERLANLTSATPSLQGGVQVLKRRLEELMETKRRLATKIGKGEQEEVLAYIRAGDGLALSKTIAAVFDDLEAKIVRQFPDADISQIEMQKKTMWQLVAAQAGAVFVGVLVMELFLAAFAVPQRSET